MTESPEGRLPEKVARSFAEQMLSALQCARTTGSVGFDPPVWVAGRVAVEAVDNCRETVKIPIGGLKVGFFRGHDINGLFNKSIIQEEVNLKVN